MAVPSEIAQKTIACFEAAAEFNLQTPSRIGNLIELSPDVGDDVMITADLHGNRVNFDRLIQLADLDANPRRHLIMQEVCHGGPQYPQGTGCMSHLLLEDVARLKVDYPDRLHFILSNHEWAELTDYPITKANRMLNLSFRCGVQEMYGSSTDAVRKAYTRFLASCPLGVRLANGVLVCHSAPEAADTKGFDVSVFERKLTPADLAPQGEVFRLIWGRDFRMENAAAFAEMVSAKILIHGHEPCAGGFLVPNEHQVILDCCGEKACYVVLPIGSTLNQADVVKRIQFLC